MRENKDRYFANEKEMIGWIDQPSTVPFLKYITDDGVKKEFRNVVVNEMIRATKQKDYTLRLLEE